MYAANSGDLVVPEGTKIEWQIRTKETTYLEVSFSDTTLLFNSKNDFVSFKKQANKSTKYSLVTKNEHLDYQAPLTYSISVVKDAFPEIKTKQLIDSINPMMLYHSGLVSDDYGVQKLYFRFKSKDTSGSIIIPIKRLALQQSFNFSIDLKPLLIEKGNEINYYFEV